jgi:hypothetical protein
VVVGAAVVVNAVVVVVVVVVGASVALVVDALEDDDDEDAATFVSFFELEPGAVPTIRHTSPVRISAHNGTGFFHHGRLTGSGGRAPGEGKPRGGGGNPPEGGGAGGGGKSLIGASTVLPVAIVDQRAAARQAPADSRVVTDLYTRDGIVTSAPRRLIQAVDGSPVDYLVTTLWTGRTSMSGCGMPVPPVAFWNRSLPVKSCIAFSDSQVSTTRKPSSVGTHT